MAAGEEDEEAEVSVDTRDFLRRFGELEEDQLAVESPFTFSVRSNIDNVKMNQFLQRIPYKLTPDFETVKKNFEAQTKKKSKQSRIDRIDENEDNQGEEEDKVDVSRIPMEHRGGTRGLPGVAGTEKMRQLLVSAANIVLTPESVSTYLAQMWITNIMQTVGWGLIAAFTARTSGR